MSLGNCPPLFRWVFCYSLLHWPDADRYLETLLTYFKNNPTILAWDLKNEPDLDYRTAGKEVVNSWLAYGRTGCCNSSTMSGAAFPSSRLH